MRITENNVYKGFSIVSGIIKVKEKLTWKQSTVSIKVWFENYGSILGTCFMFKC